MAAPTPHHEKGDAPMSHHLDTPLAAQTGQLFIDDLYVFPGEGSTVLSWTSTPTSTASTPSGASTPEARYEFKVHFDGADFATLTFWISFTEPGHDRHQTLQLRALT